MLEIPRVGWAQLRYNRSMMLLKGMEADDIQTVARTVLDSANYRSNDLVPELSYYSPWGKVHTEQSPIRAERIVNAEQ